MISAFLKLTKLNPSKVNETYLICYKLIVVLFRREIKCSFTKCSFTLSSVQLWPYVSDGKMKFVM